MPEQSHESSRVFWRRFAARGLEGKVIFAFTAYAVVSTVTLPFAGSLWLGELPLLALIQLPKLWPAGWLRTHVIMAAMKSLGYSTGSFSPDYIAARPYALALVYAAAIAVVLIVRGCASRGQIPSRIMFAALLALGIDFGFTLVFASGRNLTLY